MSADRMCKDCGAAFEGDPRSSYCPQCKQERDEASRARSYASYKARRPRRRRAVWDSEKVVAAIQERQRQGLPLNAGAVMIDDNSLLSAARRYCGGWNNALETAGIDPAEVKSPRRKKEKWSRERVIEAIRTDATAGLPLGHRDAERRSVALVRAAAYYFGSWEEAVKAAGYDYAVARSLSRLTPAQVLDRIQSLAIAGVDLSERSCRAWDPNLYAASAGLFGSWEDAVKAAGLNADLNVISTGTRKWTEAKVIAAIRKRYAQDLPLNYQEVVNNNERLAGAARRLFGSWDNALMAAGFDPAGIKRPPGETAPRGTWSPEAIVEQIQADAEAGLDLSAHEAQKRWPALVAASTYHFGSWKSAIKTAGYDYEAIRKTRAWTPEQVAERIQTLARDGADLSDATCSAYDPPLYGAAATHYGGWAEALGAAGVDPDDARRTVKWSRNRILEAIRVGNRDKTLQMIAQQYWSSWEEACRAAGISPEDANPSSNRIRLRREELGLSQVQLAARVGVTSVYIGYLERGKAPNPRVSMALRLARALECSIEDLYGADPEKPASQNDAGAPVENPPD